MKSITFLLDLHSKFQRKREREKENIYRKVKRTPVSAAPSDTLHAGSFVGNTRCERCDSPSLSIYLYSIYLFLFLPFSPHIIFILLSFSFTFSFLCVIFSPLDPFFFPCYYSSIVHSLKVEKT